MAHGRRSSCWSMAHSPPGLPIGRNCAACRRWAPGFALDQPCVGCGATFQPLPVMVAYAAPSPRVLILPQKAGEAAATLGVCPCRRCTVARRLEVPTGRLVVLTTARTQSELCDRLFGSRRLRTGEVRTGEGVLAPLPGRRWREDEELTLTEAHPKRPADARVKGPVAAAVAKGRGRS